MKAFPVGFWNYVPIANQDETAVKDWADAGMTLALSPEFGPVPEDVSRVRKILDAAHERGITVVLCHEHSYWRHLTKKGEETYRREFTEAVRQLGSHPAVFGFHVGDEPGAPEFKDACRAVRIHKELAPHLKPFLNLLPWHPSLRH